MLFLNQVVKGVYMLIHSMLHVFLWQFFFDFYSATILPQKLGVFLKILMIPPKTKKPVIPNEYRFFYVLDHF